MVTDVASHDRTLPHRWLSEFDTREGKGLSRTAEPGQSKVRGELSPRVAWPHESPATAHLQRPLQGKS
jgi:hypothetical protein